jgi:iron(III) transport system permease protein
VLLAVSGAILGYLVIVPAALLVLTSLHVKGADNPLALTLRNFVNLLTTGGGTAVLVNSAVFAVAGAAGAVAIGTLLAWVVERTDSPLRTFTYAVMFISLALPGIFKAVGWIVILGPRAGFLNQALATLLGDARPVIDIFSLPGMILVEVLVWLPSAFLLMSAPLRQMDPSLEEAGQMSGASRAQTLKRVTMPLVLPSMLALGLLALVRMLESFEVPTLIGLPGRTLVLTSQLYLTMSKGLITSYEEPSAYAVLLTVPVALGLLLYLRLTRQAQRFQTVTGKGFRPVRQALGPWRPLAAAGLAGACLLMLLPVLALTWTSLFNFVIPPSAAALSQVTFANYASVGAIPRLLGSLGNTLLVSVASATVVIALVAVAAWVVIRSRLRARFALDYLATAPLTFPGIVLGLALLQIYLWLQVGVYNTLWILVIAFVTLFLPYGMRYVSAGLLQIREDLEESASASGARWHQGFLRVTMPLCLPALFAGWAFVFLHSATELSASILLSGPRSQVASVLMFQLWQEGQVNQIGAFAVVYTLPLVAIALALLRLSARYGVQP